MMVVIMIRMKIMIFDADDDGGTDVDDVHGADDEDGADVVDDAELKYCAGDVDDTGIDV